MTKDMSISHVENVAIHYNAHVGSKEKIKEGFLRVGERVSYVMRHLYSLDGFEKLTKFVIVFLKSTARLLGMGVVFENALKTLDPLKDLYYATMVFNSAADFVKITKVEGKNKFHFQVPTIKTKNNEGKIEEGVDWVKVLLAIGNCFETGKFLQKYQVYSFDTCTQIANQLGNVKLFNFRGRTYSVQETPILCTICDKPKDLFVFLASIIEVKRCLEKPFDLANILKITGSIGKMVLITFGPFYSKAIWFNLADFITQFASLASFIKKVDKEKEVRFQRPGAAAA